MVVEQSTSATPIETRVAPDGVGYTWAEFADYYFDVNLAAEIWAAAAVAAAPEPISPRFELGSIVRVLADTTPGVRPMHAEGILVAKVLDFADEGHYYVAPIDSKKRRRVSGALLIPTSIDGPTALFRGDGRSGGAGARAIARANDSAEKAMKKAKVIVSEVVKKAERVVSTAQTKIVKVITAATIGSAKIAKEAQLKIAHAQKVADRQVRVVESDASARVEAESERAAIAEDEASRAAKTVKAQRVALAASEAEKDALFAGDPDDPRLSGRGRKLARVLDEGRNSSYVQAERRVEFERTKRVEAERVAEAAAEEIAHLRTLKSKALAEKRAANKAAGKILKKAEKAGGRSKCAQTKLPEAVRQRLEAAEADVVAAETEKEELEEHVAELEETVKKLRSKLDAKSKVEFDRLRSEPLKGEDGTNLINVLGKEGAPDLQFMAHAILERVPALKPRYVLTLTYSLK